MDARVPPPSSVSKRNKTRLPSIPSEVPLISKSSDIPPSRLPLHLSVTSKIPSSARDFRVVNIASVRRRDGRIAETLANLQSVSKSLKHRSKLATQKHEWMEYANKQEEELRELEDQLHHFIEDNQDTFLKAASHALSIDSAFPITSSPPFLNNTTGTADPSSFLSAASHSLSSTSSSFSSSSSKLAYAFPPPRINSKGLTRQITASTSADSSNLTPTPYDFPTTSGFPLQLQSTSKSGSAKRTLVESSSSSCSSLKAEEVLKEVDEFKAEDAEFVADDHLLEQRLQFEEDVWSLVNVCRHRTELVAVQFRDEKKKSENAERNFQHQSSPLQSSLPQQMKQRQQKQQQCLEMLRGAQSVFSALGEKLQFDVEEELEELRQLRRGLLPTYQGGVSDEVEDSRHLSSDEEDVLAETTSSFSCETEQQRHLILHKYSSELFTLEERALTNISDLQAQLVAARKECLCAAQFLLPLPASSYSSSTSSRPEAEEAFTQFVCVYDEFVKGTNRPPRQIYWERLQLHFPQASLVSLRHLHTLHKQADHLQHHDVITAHRCFRRERCRLLCRVQKDCRMLQQNEQSCLDRATRQAKQKRKSLLLQNQLRRSREEFAHRQADRARQWALEQRAVEENEATTKRLHAMHVLEVKECAEKYKQEKKENCERQRMEEKEEEQRAEEAKLRLHKLHAVRTTRRKLLDHLRAEERQERKRIHQEERQKRQQRLLDALEKFKVIAPRDPERLLRETEASHHRRRKRKERNAAAGENGDPFYDYDDGNYDEYRENIGMFGVRHGYSVDQLMADTRLQLSSALHAAGLYGTEACREAMQQTQPNREPRRDMIGSGNFLS